MVGMPVRADVAHGDITPRCLLDPAAREDPVAVAIQEQGQQHVRMVLLITTSPLVDEKLADWHHRGRFDREVDDMVGRQPFLEVIGQQ